MTMTITNVVLAMARRQQGVRCDEVHGMTVRQANSVTSRLVQRGLLFKACVGWRNTRYFTRVTDRDAYIKSWNEQHAARPVDKADCRTFAHGGKAAWSLKTPAIETDSTVYITLPCRFQPRYEGIVGQCAGYRVSR